MLALRDAGVAIKEIVRRTGHSRGMVRRVLRGERSEVFRSPGELARPLPALAGRSLESRPAWRRGSVARAARRGLPGLMQGVGEWATHRRRADEANLERLRRTPSARTVARLLTSSRDHLSRAETVTVAAIEAAAPALVEAREIVEAFHVRVRKKTVAALDPRLDRADSSLVGAFARGLARDHPAVRAAIATAWSNAKAEGQINKLKLVKRQMYDSGTLDLLQGRPVGLGA